MPRYDMHIEQDIAIHVITAKTVFTVEAADRAAVEAIIDRMHAAADDNNIETVRYPPEAVDPACTGKIVLVYDKLDDRGVVSIAYQQVSAAVLTLADYMRGRYPDMH